MGFDIDYGGGVFSAILIVLLVSAGAIAVTFLIAGTRRARKDAIELDPDGKGPEL